MGTLQLLIHDARFLTKKKVVMAVQKIKMNKSGSSSS